MSKLITRESILADALKVSQKAGALTRDTYRQLGKFSDMEVSRFFSGFSALRASVLGLAGADAPELTPADILDGVAGCLRSGPKTRAEIAAKLKIDRKALDSALLTEHHYCVSEIGDMLALDKPPFGRLELKNIDNGGWVRYGLVADTHLCCREERLDALHSIYDLFEKEDITTVLHAGNIVDGYIQKINGASVVVSTPDDQAQYVIDNYPKRKNIVTRYITGDDHEGWWIKVGFNWGNYLMMLANQQGREDLVYIGHVEADIAVQNESGKSIIIKVQHPGGGSAYARSYTAQKQVEAFQGGEKPQILIQGHYHVSNYMNDRNVHVIGMPGFQDQTVFARKKRLRMEIGGVILEFKQSPNDGSITRLRPEFITYFDRGYYRPFLRSDVKLMNGGLIPSGKPVVTDKPKRK